MSVRDIEEGEFHRIPRGTDTALKSVIEGIPRRSTLSGEARERWLESAGRAGARLLAGRAIDESGGNLLDNPRLEASEEFLPHLSSEEF